MVKNTWALQDAKNGFSRVVDSALKDGPQTVTRHGKEAVIILSVDDYREATRNSGSLVDFFQASPLKGLDLDTKRTKDTGREVEL
ncbi:MAG: type II toxin-antitoxin system Phd/YefM family antitoxin [Kiritimatiellales bacterium]|nr:type II toxin-antitoxin system Phd/YefM family antitoxin [Kiritimatiellales bacterium]